MSENNATSLDELWAGNEGFDLGSNAGDYDPFAEPNDEADSACEPEPSEDTEDDSEGFPEDDSESDLEDNSENITLFPAEPPTSPKTATPAPRVEAADKNPVHKPAGDSNPLASAVGRRDAEEVL